jgi:hypothetical protein
MRTGGLHSNGARPLAGCSTSDEFRARLSKRKDARQLTKPALSDSPGLPTRSKRTLWRAIRLISLFPALQACAGEPSGICAEQGRQLTEHELISRALQNAPAFINPVSAEYDALSPIEKREFGQAALSYIDALVKNGDVPEQNPDCCRVVEPEEIDSDGVPRAMFERDEFKIYKAVKFRFVIPFTTEAGAEIKVPVDDGFFINNCGTTEGIGDR